MMSLAVQAKQRPFRRKLSSDEMKSLASDLRSRVKGEVRFDDGSRALYATDASNYRQVPIGVVIPATSDDLKETLTVCGRHGAPVLLRGTGTSLAGQTCNEAVVVDVSKYVRNILEVDPERRLARVQPGVVLDVLRAEAEKHHLTFGPDPATHRWCTIGGMIGNNSCGVHSIMAGKTVDNVEELEIRTYDGLQLRVGRTSDEELESIISAGGRRGDIYAGLRSIRDRYGDLIRSRFPNIPRRVSGYNLDQLLPENDFNVARALVGTEGTCVTVLEATVRLVYSPPVRVLLVLGYPDIYISADHVSEIMAFGPIGLEGFDDLMVNNQRKKRLNTEALPLLPEGNGWLLAEFGAETVQEATDRARALMDSLEKSDGAPAMRLFDTPGGQRMIWDVREAGLGASAQAPGWPHGWEGWEDAAVPPERLGGFLRDQRKLFAEYGYQTTMYGHFGHGCVHFRINFDLITAEGIRKYRKFVDESADLVVDYGGSLSGEHGDGQCRAELLPKMFGPELVEAFGEFKALWDPGSRMNPGKVVDAYPITSNLRLGTSYNPWNPKTHFRFPEDDGSFARAALRCVGVGKCRRTDGGTMCPSYMVLREEKHSTRGRAHLLFEMLQGDPIDGGWRDERVKESLDLCLACKGCKGDCPVNVDVGTYKAEFLSHYYAGRIRPLSAYLFGLLPYWAPLVGRIPRVANAFTQTPLVRDLVKAAVGIAPERNIPEFALESFRAWFSRRAPRNQDSPPVLLWTDNFNNYFHPQTLIAAAEVLEAAGFRVLIPDKDVSEGRTVYDSGMLDLAKHLLRGVMESLRPQIRAGIPVIGLEPSAIAVFRDELKNLFPDDEDSKRLSAQSFLLGEFLDREGFDPPKLNRKAIVHGHCHHKAVMTMAAEQRLMTKMGLDFTVLDSGCCGMAGSFGFERDHYDLSLSAGERVLLPAVRKAPLEALVVADGFSCREQIAHATDRRALHLAQVIHLAMREGPEGPSGEYPEASYVRSDGPERQPNHLGLAIAVSAAAAFGVGALALALKTGNRRR